MEPCCSVVLEFLLLVACLAGSLIVEPGRIVEHDSAFVARLTNRRSESRHSEIACNVGLPYTGLRLSSTSRATQTELFSAFDESRRAFSCVTKVTARSLRATEKLVKLEHFRANRP